MQFKPSSPIAATDDREVLLKSSSLKYSYRDGNLISKTFVAKYADSSLDNALSITITWSKTINIETHFKNKLISNQVKREIVSLSQNMSYFFNSTCCPSATEIKLRCTYIEIQTEPYIISKCVAYIKCCLKDELIKWLTSDVWRR